MVNPTFDEYIRTFRNQVFRSLTHTLQSLTTVRLRRKKRTFPWRNGGTRNLIEKVLCTSKGWEGNEGRGVSMGCHRLTFQTFRTSETPKKIFLL